MCMTFDFHIERLYACIKTSCRLWPYRELVDNSVYLCLYTFRSGDGKEREGEGEGEGERGTGEGRESEREREREGEEKRERHGERQLGRETERGMRERQRGLGEGREGGGREGMRGGRRDCKREGAGEAAGVIVFLHVYVSMSRPGLSFPLGLMISHQQGTQQGFCGKSLRLGWGGSITG